MGHICTRVAASVDSPLTTEAIQPSEESKRKETLKRISAVEEPNKRRGSRTRASDRPSIRFDTTANDVAVEAMVRQFARKSMSLEEPRKRRESHIEDRDVLELLTSKSGQPKEYGKIHDMFLDNLDKVRELSPDLANRVEIRRKTMEKLDVFSPDTAPERLEELYDATERLMRAKDVKL